MLSVFRGFLNTWAARAFFVVLLSAFGLWGVADVVRNIGQDNALATVGDAKIDPLEFQQAFRTDLAQVNRMMPNGGELAPELRRAVAQQTLERLVIQAAITQEVRRLGIAVSDDALRQAVYEIPAFKGAGGVFDRGVFTTLLRNAGMSEARFLDGLRGDLAKGQLVDTVRVGVASPDTPIRQLYAFSHEQRVGDIVEVSAAASPEPPAPSAEDLQRYWEGNPARYTTPAYRRVSIVALLPEALARSVDVPEDEIRGYYDQHQREYVTEETRAAEVIIAPDEAAAQKLAAQWRAGANWTAMDGAAKAAGATSLTLDLSTRQQIPATDLADAIFKAARDQVTDPVKTAAGYAVVHVTDVQGGTRSYEAVKGEIRDKLALDRAVDQVDANTRKLQDLLSAGTDFDHLPPDLGLIGMTGTTDAQGKTPGGDPAPIPGSEAVRAAILQTAFATAPGDPPRLIDGPEHAEFAVVVEQVVPASVQKLADVEGRVREDWVAAQRRRGAEQVAAGLLGAAQGGTPFADAALKAGVRIDQTPAVTRAGSEPGVAAAVRQALFGLKPGEVTMVETADGFAVVRLASVSTPDPAADPAGLAQAREGLTRALDQDVAVVFATILRDRAGPRVNTSMLQSLVE